MAGSDAAVDALAKVDLFSGLSPRDLQEVAAMAKEVDFAAGEALTEEGTQGARFYVLLEGAADVLVGDDVVNKLGPGDSLGEVSLIDNEPRSATVIARTPVRTLALSSWNFRPLLREHPSISEAVLLEMCRRLRMAQASHLH